MAGRKRTGQPKAIRKMPAAIFGLRLEHLVDASGMTVAEFAAAIGKSEQAVRFYFKGTNTPKLNDWPLLAKTLGLKTINELLPELVA